MYIDLIVLIVLIVVVIMFFKRFSSFVFFIAIVDILLRVLTFIANNIGLPDVSAVITNHVPGSIFAIIDSYITVGTTLNMVFKWAFIFIMICFLFYIIKIFINKKKF